MHDTPQDPTWILYECKPFYGKCALDVSVTDTTDFILFLSSS